MRRNAARLRTVFLRARRVPEYQGAYRLSRGLLQSGRSHASFGNAITRTTALRWARRRRRLRRFLGRSSSS